MQGTPAQIQIGIFDRIDRADAALQRLIDAGVAKDRISVVRATDAPHSGCAVDEVEPGTGRVVPAAVIGGAIGSVIGGLTAAVGVVASGGTGLLIAGPLLGGAAGMGLAGSFVGVMAQRGVKPELTDFYDQALRDGQLLVAVEPSDDSAQPSAYTIDRLLEQAGAATNELQPARATERTRHSTR